MYTPPKIERFNENVLSKYHIYNSVFITLPFDSIDNTGVLLPLFSEMCESGFKQQLNPRQIFEQFSDKFLDNKTEQDKINLMFRFIQYIERQIVLFDAIEDAAFPIVNNMEGRGSLRDINEKAEAKNKLDALRDFFRTFKVRTVLTAHPTQFYPGPVLGIITDLTIAVRENDLQRIKELLAQLGKTPFIKKEKPTPFDEAVSLVWYLENVFYYTAGDMVHYINKNIFKEEINDNSLLNFGFWPGGDRDGNPFVTTEITLRVASRLRIALFRCYYNEIRRLKRKLTFYDVDILVTEIELKLYDSIHSADDQIFLTLDELKQQLNVIKRIVEQKHQSLYLDDLDLFISNVGLFGFHFASLDVRQNSRIHHQVFEEIAKEGVYLANGYLSADAIQKAEIISNAKPGVNPNDYNEITRSTLESVYAMRTIQSLNGEMGCNRYIISNNETALDVLQALALFRLCGWDNPTVDIVPLFEVIDDLRNAKSVMESLYTDEAYQQHLARRGNKQTVMLGFSDGTKDGGYLMANWSIYKAKEEITEISREYGIKVIFFDGRGGPPARGGGKTHKFYASLGPNIENREIQITIQGQTISSNFGTLDSCRYNLENLLSAGVANQIFDKDENLLSGADKKILDELAEKGFEKYTDFKNHPKFIPYLEQVSTLKYFAKANIGSRPAKRSKSDRLEFSELRAIPFVGSWSQLKQNVPGFFGVGSALSYFETSGRWHEIQHLFDHSLFVKTLLENSMMSLAKSFFPLTAYMKEDPEFGPFWTIIYEEFLLTKRLLLKIAGHTALMENYPDGKASIEMREHIVMPLLTIQQYALLRVKELNAAAVPDENLIAVYEKIVTRSLFGNTNASRNSA
ncbi:MAG: phosphoenolpyruvate carboxylase [Flavobacterium sp. BFFFF1]|uniref:phosphoenolpyruvate carboxylase n=1 Tax=Flavobacterium sp. BFFFF1 TaxID=2015557 RepID=UPI000BDC69DD|nr:phosphoenolpyruvate carboxylase [Flavobacterium sp. BFFFF1]OYU81760.1 MAG: phosphoenolpyruvate carboxylase [Flavobacterium sp. BFFFF1]